jgi:hypothetical protein
LKERVQRYLIEGGRVKGKKGEEGDQRGNSDSEK